MAEGQTQATSVDGQVQDGQAQAEQIPAQQAAESQPADATDWKAEARKWEARAKENKAKADAYDEAQEAAKSDLQKALERADKAEGKLKEYESKLKLDKLRAEIAKEYGLDADLLRGGTEEELRAHAETIKAYVGGTHRYPSVPDYGEANAPAGNRSTASLFADAVNAIR